MDVKSFEPKDEPLIVPQRNPICLNIGIDVWR
jgi:hypothetical protein